MCAINPVHKKRFIIDIYTSILMKDFEYQVIGILLKEEIKLNSENPAFRFHLKETEQEAE